jgi:hypothetical protein
MAGTFGTDFSTHGSGGGRAVSGEAVFEQALAMALPGPRELESIAGPGWKAVRFRPGEGREAVWGRFEAPGGGCFAAALAGKGGAHTIDISSQAIGQEIKRCNREGTVAQIYGEAVRSYIIRRVKAWGA